MSSEKKNGFTNEKADPFYSKENQERLRRSIEQIESGEVVTKSLEEIKELARE